MSESGEVPADARLRLTLQAFCETHEPAWHGFTLTQVGAEQDAALVVDAMKSHLRRNWALALRQEVPAAYAWRLLKEHVAAWMLHTGRDRPALAESHALDPALLWLAGGRAAVAAGTHDAFYPAVLRLPERQHDVVVLKHALRLADDDIAAFLGRSPAAVRSTLRHAHRNLTRILGLPDPADPEEEA